MFERLHDLIDLFVPPEVPGVLAALGVTQEEYEQLREKVRVARNTPPRIALIGETGVGKSTTINALFNQNEPVSHTEACTQHEKELTVERGTLRVVDMPGLGEDMDRDKAHMSLYAKELPICDVALWVFKADNRAFSNIERCLHELIEGHILDSRRLVIGLNQVDALHPSDWNTTYNIPSAAQDETIAGRIADVRAKLKKIRGLDPSRIVAYSALKNYRLPDLLIAMKDAGERRVQWALGNLANFRAFDADVKSVDREDDNGER